MLFYGATKVRVYHHNDMDGKCAGYMIHKFLDRIKIDNNPEDFTMKGYDDPFDKHDKDTMVFIVDLSFTTQTIHRLEEICNEAACVILIDHHKSTLDAINANKKKLASIPNLAYMVEMEGCGAMLCYAFGNIFDSNSFNMIFNFKHHDFTFDRKTNSDIPIIKYACYLYNNQNEYPTILQKEEILSSRSPIMLIDAYDRWTGDFQPDTDNFIMGCDLNNTALTVYNKRLGRRVFNPFWGKLFDPGNGGVREVNRYITNGEIIAKYLNSRYHREVTASFEKFIPGWGKILFLNGRGNSWNFVERIKDYDAVSLYSYNGRTGNFIYSIYADDKSSFNCKAFAEQFGGGGHFHAAGWQSEKQMYWASDKLLNKDDEGNISIPVISLLDIEIDKEIKNTYDMYSRLSDLNFITTDHFSNPIHFMDNMGPAIVLYKSDTKSDIQKFMYEREARNLYFILFDGMNVEECSKKMHEVYKYCVEKANLI